jgi:glucosamine--fructose-6-phosphate aminotransferase (isomerizing)
MCGIVGYVGPRPVVPLLIEGLRRLEYRGYDSAGVAVVENGHLETRRAEGKLDRLVEKLAEQPLAGRFGVAHTRWATHGKPIEKNAHPIVDSKRRIAVIHNGIVENYLPIKRRLQAAGWSFATDTDTEVIANLVSSYYEGDLAAAVRRAVVELEGMYACALIATGSPGEMVTVRQGTPLVLGVGAKANGAAPEMFLASDPAALLAYTKDVVFLDNGDVARQKDGEITVWDRSGRIVERPGTRLNWDPIQAEKGGYKHFMLKEIHEQPEAVQETFGGRLDFETGAVSFETMELAPDYVQSLSRIQLLACGTSWHAAQIGKFLIEELARIPVEVDYASEYRYRDPIADASVLVAGVSQSGETIDTVWAMEAAKERGARLIAICNVPGSQATRISSGVVYTHAGPEIGVASTKAFTTQLVALYLFALYLRQQQGRALAPELVAPLAHVPKAVRDALALERETDELARRFLQARDFLYLARGIDYPVALEGALKLKEISYIHAEGYPAGEMKHGPIALIDEHLPVVAIATGRRVFDKVKSNLQEVKARDGQVIVVTDRDPAELDGVADHVLRVPSLPETLQPIVNVVPLQLLAYQIGVRRGADVDQPRNLAKSVTVE